MKAWRTPIYLLLAINLVLALLSGISLLGQRLPWAESGERERLARQLTPDQIRVGEPVAAQSAQASSTLPAASADCALIRSLTQEDSQQLEGMARDYAARLGVSIRSRSSGIVPNSYWVHIPPSGGREGATKRAEVLTRAGVTDLIIIRDPGPNQYAVSLGLFRSEEAAKRLMEQLRSKKISTVRMAVRDNTGTNARTELTGPPLIIDALLQDFLATHAQARRDSCTPDTSS